MKIPVKGIDMNIVGDRWLLMILTDQVLKLDVEMLKHAPTAMMISWAVDATNTEIRESPWKSRRRESAAMLAG